MSEQQPQQQMAIQSRTRRIDALMAVIVDSLTSMFNNIPGQAAASIAYYFLFSIFPLFLFLVIVLSYFLDINFVQEKLIRVVQEIIPGAEVLITENLQSLLANRSSNTILASISLLWSGSGMISSLVFNVQKPYPETNRRGFFINRAFAIVFIIFSILLIAGVMVFSFVFNISDALAFFNIKLTRTIQVLIHLFSTYILPIIFLYLAAFVLYYMVPTAKVDRGAARISSLLFAVIWRIFMIVFSRYVLSPMNRYDLLYGSVTVIALLLLFIYFSAFILLYFAHLTAAITHYKQRRAGLLASAPINPKPIRPKEPVRGKKKGKGAQSNVRTLSDPVILDPNVGEKPKPSVWQQIWEIVIGLFRWK